jgi:EAL domain-containing protein (putative c-di-GMP-specific phosphodiesterase class I)
VITVNSREARLSLPAEPSAPVVDGPVRDSWLAIRALVEKDDLRVVFQPIVDLTTGETFAYEALVRCQIPRYASPTVLFERASKLGCAGRLGRMIREIAIPLASGHPLFINIHPHELNEGWLVRPDDPIYEHDAPVYLEITESVPLTHFDLVMSVLREVKTRGNLQLVVDDLGAGYSNLKSIIDLEPQVVKLDRGLIAGVEKSPRQRQLVSSVVSLCRDLKARVVVEGIETEDELSALRDSGADFAQGYLFARPNYPLPTVSWPANSMPPRCARR